MAASSLLASAFTSGDAAEGGAAMAGVGAHMTAKADCRPASFTPTLLALRAQQNPLSVAARAHFPMQPVLADALLPPAEMS
jgi:hypothetical protein